VECVWYRSVLEKEEKDDEGRTRWSQVSDESSEVPFWVQDDSGRVLVRPKGASVYATERRRDVHAGAPSRATGLSVLRMVAGIESLPVAVDLARYRSTEWIIRPGESIYVLGEATLRRDAVALEFAPCDPGGSVRRRSLLVATGDERGVARRTAWQGLALLVLTLAGAVGAVAAVHAVRTVADGGPLPGDPSTLEATRGWMVVAVLVVLGLLPVLYVGRLFNRLVAARQRVAAAWSLVDVQLRRRHDLIPQVAAAVRAAAEHERTTLVEVAERRLPEPDHDRLPDDALLDRAADLDATDRAEGRSLLALAEGYPSLRADAAFVALARELVATEDAVAFARTFYNDAVNVLRDRRQQLPGRFLAPLVPVPTTREWEPDLPAARPAATAPAPPSEPPGDGGDVAQP
jgi:LemA protein